MAVDLTTTATVPANTTLDITVYEDTTGDGTADNQETVSVADGTNTYTLSTLSGGAFGYEYWLGVQPSTTDVTATPVLDSAEVDNGATVAPESINTAARLNGGSIDLTVYEDTTGDGNADNQTTFSVPDGGTETDLSGTSLDFGAGNDYWLELSVSTPDVTATPKFERATLNTEKAETVDAGSIVTATGSSLTGNETATLSEPAGVVVAAGSPVTAAEVTEATPGAALVDAVATVLGAAETTEATGAAITTGQTATLSVSEVTEAVEAGLVSAVVTPLTATETATLSEPAGVQTATATPLTATEEKFTIEAGSVTAAAATSVTAAEAVEDLIAGSVTLSGSGVQGAKVYVIDTDADTVVGTATTDVNGDYSVTVPAEPPYHVAVQYDDGSQKYNALSKPFIE